MSEGICQADLLSTAPLMAVALPADSSPSAEALQGCWEGFKTHHCPPQPTLHRGADSAPFLQTPPWPSRGTAAPPRQTSAAVHTPLVISMCF